MSENTEEKKVGRPSSFTQEIADSICLQLATSSKGLAQICRQKDMPCTTTIYRWLEEDEHKEFKDSYARAKKYQAEFMASEVVEIADNSIGDVTKDAKGNYVMDGEFARRSHIRMEARKWYASKLAPKKYGDKLDVTTDGDKIQGPSIIIQHPDGNVDLSED